MTRGTVLKFIFISLSNIKKLLLVNLVFIIPLLIFIFALIQLVPFVVHYIDTMNVSILQVNPGYGKIVLVMDSFSGAGEKNKVEEQNKDVWIYIFKKSDLNRARRYFFLDLAENKKRELLFEKAIGVNRLRTLEEPFSIKDKHGNNIITLALRGVSESSVEIFYINPDFFAEEKPLTLYIILIIVSYFLIAGCLGGIADYIQRIVFHETKKFGYLTKAVIKHFMKSLIIAFIFTLVVSATITNIYYYLFISGGHSSVFVAGINFWMLIFFIVIFIWVYPIMALGSDEPVWKMMRKSLFISFDNFDFTIKVLIFLFLIGMMSVLSLFTLPGIAGTFSFLNTSLKEISSRYSSTDST